MADEQTKVEYQFTGSVGSLQKAVESAIGLLDKYQKKIDSIGEIAAAPAQKISKKLQEPLKQVMTEVDQLQKKFQALQNTKVFQGSSAAAQMSTSMKNLQQQLTAFQNRSKITATDVKGLASAVRNTKQAFAEAGPQIDVIVQKEQKFQEVLNSIRERSNAMATAIHSAFDKITGPLDGASSKLESFKAKAAEALNHASRMAEAAGSGFRQFKGDTEAAADSHSVLASAISKIKNAVGQETQSIEDEDSELNKKNKTLKSSSVAHKAFSVVVKGLVTALKVEINMIRSAARAIGSLITKTQQATTSTNLLHKVFQRGVWEKFGESVWGAAQKSIAFIENLNLFTVAMGGSIDEASKFIDTMAEIYGMDVSNLYRYSGYFYQLTDAIGATSEASKIMSLSLTKAANDIASLFNVEIEHVVDNLAAGMQGMSRAVRQYGIDIRQTTLQQTALNYGFTESVATTSEANRQALRYLTIMDQVKNATKQVTTTVDGSNKVMGDFARNIETPANQLRILKEQVSQLGRAVGNFLLPIMQSTLYVLNGIIMALKTILTFLASLVGIDISKFGGDVSQGADDAADSIGGIGSAAADSAKKLKQLTAPFDELNILSENAGGGAGGGGVGSDLLDPSLAAALEGMELTLDEVRMKALDVRDALLEVLGLKLTEGGEVELLTGGFVDTLVQQIHEGDFEAVGASVAELLNKGIKWGVEHTDPERWRSSIKETVDNISSLLNGFVKGLEWEDLGYLLANGINLALIALNEFFTTFSWFNLGEGLGNLINGFIKNIDANELGESFANRINAGFEFMLGLASTFEWDENSQKLADAINAFIKGIDTETIADAFKTVINGGITALGNLFGTENGIQFGDLGTKIGTALSNLITGSDTEEGINWDGLGSALGAGFQQAIQFLINLLNGGESGTTLLGGLGTALATALNGVMKGITPGTLGEGIETIIKNLLEGLKNFAEEFEWDTFGSSVVRELIGIDWWGLLMLLAGVLWETFKGVVSAAWSAIMEIGKSIGNAIIDGIKGAVSAAWSALMEIGEYIGNTIIDGIKSVFSIDSIIAFVQDIFSIPEVIRRGAGLSDAQAIGRSLGDGVVEGLNDSTRTEVPNWAQGLTKDVNSEFDIHSPSGKFKTIGQFLISGLLEGLKSITDLLSVFTDFYTDVKTGAETNVTDVTKSYTDLGTAVNTILTTMSTTAKTVTTDITSMFSTMATNSITKIDSIITSLNNIPRNITTTHTIITEEVKSSGSSIRSTSTRVRGMATGGVVTGPTQALIGEGLYDEAVIPLGNSPQMEELVQRIADAVSNGSNNSSQPIVVQVQIGDKEWDAFTYESAQRGEKLVGASPIKEDR